MTLSLKERMTLVLIIEELCTGIFQNGDDLVFFFLVCQKLYVCYSRMGQARCQLHSKFDSE